MEIPLFSALENVERCYPEDNAFFLRQFGRPAPRGWYFCQRMHPNPRLWKYRWWVFHRESTAEGRVFLEPEHSLCTARAMEVLEDLQQREMFYLVYNRGYPRRDPSNPFNPGHPRWAGVKWAPAWEEDPDSVWRGHK
ncbi:MAG: hypothetical protein WDA75_01440 [Candidatus Latescibacterota bacterium]